MSAFIFFLGMMLGLYLENWRIDKVQLDLRKSEISSLDEQLRSQVLEDFKINCDDAKKSIFNFTDKVYDEIVKLEKYDFASTFSQEELRLLHKRYDLLRLMIWKDAIKIKSQCPSEFHTVIYMFNYATDSPDIRAEQTAFSRVLIDLKYAHPDEILLIPIAANLGLDSIHLMMKAKNISSAPSIIIDEETIIDKPIPVSSLEEIIFSNATPINMSFQNSITMLPVNQELSWKRDYN